MLSQIEVYQKKKAAYSTESVTPRWPLSSETVTHSQQSIIQHSFHLLSKKLRGILTLMSIY